MIGIRECLLYGHIIIFIFFFVCLFQVVTGDKHVFVEFYAPCKSGMLSILKNKNKMLLLVCLCRRILVLK